MQFADIKNDVAFRKIFGNEQWTKEDLIAYDNVSIKVQDERGEREIIVQKAEKKGKMDVAKKMKDRGMPNKDISDLTGLLEAEIDML